MAAVNRGSINDLRNNRCFIFLVNNFYTIFGIFILCFLTSALINDSTRYSSILIRSTVIIRG